MLSPFIILSPRQSGDLLAASLGHCVAIVRGILRVARNETTSDCLPQWSCSWKSVLYTVVCCSRTPGLEQMELPYSDKTVGLLPQGFSAAVLLMEISKSWCPQWGFSKCCVDA